jgi:phosphoribosylformylglycinamidine cyclo-ligase
MISGPKEGYSFDISGVMTGYIKKIKTMEPKPGQVIIGFRSSGPHSNGFTALRTKLLRSEVEERPQFRQQYTGRFLLTDRPCPEDPRTLGEILLTPTKIYLKAMAAITKYFPAVFGVNITGYGLHNFNRIGKNIRFVIDNPFPQQPIFKLMEQESGYSTKKMYTKFNMGMGFAIFANKEDAEQIIDIAKQYDVEAMVIGHIEESEEVITILKRDNEMILFRGY